MIEQMKRFFRLFVEALVSISREGGDNGFSIKNNRKVTGELF